MFDHFSVVKSEQDHREGTRRQKKNIEKELIKHLYVVGFAIT